MKQNRKLLRPNQLRQAPGFARPRVARLHWLAMKRRFVERLPNVSIMQDL